MPNISLEQGLQQIYDALVAGIPVTTDSATTATLANVSSSATNVTLLAANTARKGAYFYNDSTQILYLKLGATATTSSYTVEMGPEDFYELPNPIYVGIIDGIWASANGALRVTEIT